jgi:predicted transcriptional regulator
MEESGLEQLTSSKGDYLKVLYDLSAMEDGIRSVDIARRMDLSLPSVSRAMKELSEEGYVSRVKYGTIRLTEKGARSKSATSFCCGFLCRFWMWPRLSPCGMPAGSNTNSAARRPVSWKSI